MPVYRVWIGMHQRCNNSHCETFRHYGARGIKVCDRWNSVHAFLEDMGHPPTPEHSIGRIDNDGPYEPNNCRWETIEQQNNNTRRSRYVTWNGRSQTIKSWAEELDMEPRRISERLRRGWPVERALTEPTPLGYQKGRALQNQRARELWKLSGERYRQNTAQRKFATRGQEVDQ